MPLPHQFFLLFLCFLTTATADLMRTVYCANKCNDYLKVPEASIPKCERRHLQLNQCGTVISCSWSDVEEEKQRPVANATDEIICCYDVILKEKGDCDAQHLPSSSQHPPKIVSSSSASSDCASQTPALFSVIAVLLLVIAAQTFYIMWTCAFQRCPCQQKIGQFEEATVTQPPRLIFAARPACESHLLSFEQLSS
uniref:Protein sleepless n=1 Tax=Caenorhabditis japonica TaxID=281687 RepID=A0A8R1DVS2_CAEJA